MNTTVHGTGFVDLFLADKLPVNTILTTAKENSKSLIRFFKAVEYYVDSHVKNPKERPALINGRVIAQACSKNPNSNETKKLQSDTVALVKSAPDLFVSGVDLLKKCDPVAEALVNRFSHGDNYHQSLAATDNVSKDGIGWLDQAINPYFTVYEAYFSQTKVKKLDSELGAEEFLSSIEITQRMNDNKAEQPYEFQTSDISMEALVGRLDAITKQIEKSNLSSKKSFSETWLPILTVIGTVVAGTGLVLSTTSSQISQINSTTASLLEQSDKNTTRLIAGIEQRISQSDVNNAKLLAQLQDSIAKSNQNSANLVSSIEKRLDRAIEASAEREALILKLIDEAKNN